LDKRLPLFLFLAFLIFFLWNLAFPPPPAARERPAGSALPPAAEPASIAAKAASEPPALADDVERELVLSIGGAGEPGPPGRRGAYRARFSNRGARLVSLELADYFRAVGLDEAARADPASWLPLIEPVETAAGPTGSLLWDTRASSQGLAPGGLAGALWKMEELAPPEVGVRFRYGPPGGKVVFEKKIAFEPGTWRVHLVLTLENLAAEPARLGFTLLPAGCVPAELGDQFYFEPTAVAIARVGPSDPYESDHRAAPGLDEPGALEVPTPLAVVGVHNKYFAFLLREAQQGLGTIGGASYAPVVESVPAARPLLVLEASVNLTLPAAGESRSYEYVVYAGPKDARDLVGDCPAHEIVLDDDLAGSIARTFQVDHIAKGLLAVLGLFYRLTENWGVAIILLTLCVRAALFPLNRRSQTAMARYQKKMKRVQPRLEEAKKRFEGEPQKLREAQARIMQEEGAFPPLGGCLPVFLQMPIFFGLFSALRTSFDLRQAPFFAWITDLSRPDRLLHLGWNVPLIDLEYLNVLPIAMVVLWILQQMGMPKPADEQAARMQKMMMFMPVVFGVMLYNYAAGLSIYMITTSSCSILEQKVIKRLWPIDDTEREPARRKGCGPFSGMLQHLAEKQREQMKRVQAMQAERRRQEQKRKR
jgi:YidC/Oxa1 family membrane protein insertase